MLFLPYFLTKTLAEHILCSMGKDGAGEKKTIQTHIPVYTGNAIKATQEHVSESLPQLRQ